jgi:hypothetical protein
MGWLVVAAAFLLCAAAIVLFLSDLDASRTRAFDRVYEANRKARAKHW